jgi:hypothetical protein
MIVGYEKMTLESIYYIGQTVAVAALFLSIVFVGYQIRQNTMAIKATSHHAVTDSFNQLNSLLIGDPSLGRVWRLGIAGMKNLGEDEQVSFSFMMLAYSRVFETLFYQFKNGTMDKKLFDAELSTLKWTVGNAGFREWWAINPISLSVEYRKFIDGLIADADAGTTGAAK